MSYCSFHPTWFIGSQRTSYSGTDKCIFTKERISAEIKRKQNLQPSKEQKLFFINIISNIFYVKNRGIILFVFTSKKQAYFCNILPTGHHTSSISFCVLDRGLSQGLESVLQEGRTCLTDSPFCTAVVPLSEKKFLLYFFLQDTQTFKIFL